MPDDPDGVPYPQACDALKLVGLEGHAAAHARIPDLEARLERTVAGMERFIRELESPEDPAPAMTLEMIALIASHRGESILTTMARLGGHPPRATWTGPATSQAATSMSARRVAMRAMHPDPPPPDDPRGVIRRAVEGGVRREVGEIEAFLVENRADPERHEHVTYPAPGSYPGGAWVHVLIPRDELRGRSGYPTRAEAMERYPWRISSIASRLDPAPPAP